MQNKNLLYPLKMAPVFKEYIWGGNKLNEKYNKNSPYEKTAESWEIASHKNGESKVSNGIYQGKSINELTEILGKKLLGDAVIKNGIKFPVLIKLIDARDNLSIQVHPDDEFAFTNENGELGKNEMWYIVEAENGSGIIYGFKDDTDRETFAKAIEENTVLSHTNFIECKKGDAFYIPAGMLHAIGKGLLIAEIQQNSDTTYRVYDYDRRDKDGNPRELHTKKALDVLNFKSTAQIDKKNIENGVLVDCPYFKTEKITLLDTKKWQVAQNSFETLVICEGEITVNDIPAKKGESVLLPAYIGDVTLKGNAVVLRTYIHECSTRE